MDATTETPNDLESLLKADHIGYTNLLATLEREKQLLIERDFDAFASVLENKNLLVNQLDQLASHRLKVLTALKLDASETGMQELISRQPEFGRDKLAAQWQGIKSLVAKCSRQNEVNAKIAHRAQSTSRQILNILKSTPTSEVLYDKKGTAGNNGAGLSITRA